MSHGARFFLAFMLRQEDAREDAVAVDLGDGAGLTRWGLTQKSYPDLDLRALTITEAMAIYERDYWAKIHADLIPIPVGVMLADGAVNQGPGTAVTLLQRAVGVQEDGVLGPVTAAAATNTPRVLRKLFALRAMRYAEHPRFKEWGGTWLERLAECYAYASNLPD